MTQLEILEKVGYEVWKDRERKVPARDYVVSWRGGRKRLERGR